MESLDDVADDDDEDDENDKIPNEIDEHVPVPLEGCCGISPPEPPTPPSFRSNSTTTNTLFIRGGDFIDALYLWLGTAPPSAAFFSVDPDTDTDIHGSAHMYMLFDRIDII